MTCPIAHDVSALSSALQHFGRNQQTVERFERVGGSVFAGLFAVALFDQAMVPEVSAALEATGRIRNTPWERAVRTAVADQLVFATEDAERKVESELLKELHRDVKGVSPDGVRYSALKPELWNWILYSTFFMHRGAYITLTGAKLSAAENQAIWDWFRGKSEHLELPGQSRMIESYAELESYYGRFASERLAETSTLEAAVSAIEHAPRPPFVPIIAAPLWHLSAPVVGHVVLLLGSGIMHPAVRSHMSRRWGARQEAEFTVIATALRVAYSLLPGVLTDTPLVRNQRKYRKLVAKYQGMQLSSFAPGAA